MAGKTVAEMVGMSDRRVRELCDMIENNFGKGAVTDIPQEFIAFAVANQLPTNEIVWLGMTAESILAAHRR
jgi:hypothetical protein